MKPERHAATNFFAGLLTIAALSLALARCANRQASSHSANLGQASTASVAAGAPGVVASNTVTVHPSPAPYNRHDHCGGDFLPTLSLQQQLLHVEQTCMQGMKAVFAPPQRLAVGATTETSVTVAGLATGACLRAAVISAPGGLVSLALVGTRDELLGRELPSSFALIGSQGPVCLGKAGSARLDIRNAESSPNEVWIQVWKTEP